MIGNKVCCNDSVPLLFNEFLFMYTKLSEATAPSERGHNGRYRSVIFFCFIISFFVIII